METLTYSRNSTNKCGWNDGIRKKSSFDSICSMLKLADKS